MSRDLRAEVNAVCKEFARVDQPKSWTTSGPFRQADWYWIPRIAWMKYHVAFRWLNIYWAIWF